MNRKILFIITLCLLGILFTSEQVISQENNKVEVVLIPPANGNGGKDILLPIKMFVAIYDLVNDQIQLSKEDGSAFTQDEISQVSMISGTGADFGYPDMNAGTMLFRLAIRDGDFFLKKMVAMEMDMLLKTMQLAAIQTANPVYKNVSSIGYIDGKKYIINFQIALVKVTISYPGKYLVLRNFSVIPADLNPFEQTWYSNYIGKASFYITFESLSTAELIKYPSLNIKWSTLVTGTTMVYQLPSDFDDDMCYGNFNPTVTMLAIRRDWVWGTSDTLARFDFNPGVIDGIPRSPALTIQDNEFSLTLSWSADAFATSYNIYRAESPMEDISMLTPLANATTTNFEDVSIIPGKRYFYQVLPVRSDGMEGIASNEVSGMASSPVILTLDNPNNQSYPKGESFAITGSVLSSKTQTPLTDAKVNAYIDELSFANTDVLTSDSGEFQLTAEVPAVPGTYNYIVQTQYNTEGKGVEFQLSALENPSKGHDLELYNASAGALFKQPGQSINITYSLKNRGLYQETGSIEMEIYDDQNDTVSGVILDPFTLGVGSIKNGNIAYTLPSTLNNGNYYAELRCVNELDEHRINNVQKTTFFVSDVTNPPAYRLGAYQFDSVSHSRTIDGKTVTLVSASTTTASFSVDGEVTGPLEVGDYWFNNAETFALHIVDITFFSNNNLDVDIRAGGTNSSYTHTPYFNVCHKGELTTTLITAPSGSQLNNEVNFILDPDSIILQNWLQPVSHPNNQSNKLDLTFDVPASTDSRTYYAYAKTTDNTYWWIKRLYLTPINKRNISKTGILTVSNITANGNPGNLIGDQFEISGSFENNGDFDEAIIVKFCLKDENDSIWFDHDTLDINIGGQSNFSFTLPTLGMEAKNYTIEVTAAQPEDTDTSDNKFTTNLLLEDVLEADCYFENFSSFYEAGDTIHAAVHVEHLGSTIDQANVQLEITNPGGQKRIMPAYFDTSSQSYRADYVTDLSGNYYFTATTSAKRYLNTSAEAIAKVKVYLTLQNNGNILYKGSPVEYELTTSNVGGVYAFAGHLEFNNVIFPLAAYEGNLINPGQLTQSTLSFSYDSSNMDIGVTRLDPSSPFYSAYKTHTICSFTMLCSESGTVNLNMSDDSLYDTHGETMVAQLQINPSTVIEPDLFLRFIPNDTSYILGDTLTLITSILGNSNLAGVSFDLNYNDTLLDYLGTAFHQSLGEYGEVSLIQQADDNGNGRVTLGSVRSEASKIGCDYSVIKIAETKFIVKTAGHIHFTPENIHLYSPYEGVEFSYTLESDSAVALPFDPNSFVFNADTLSLWPSETGLSSFEMSGLKNVFGVSLELNYDTSIVQIDSITEGNLLNMDGQTTTFDYSIDSVSGKVYIGITRMNNSVGGVNSDTSRTLFNILVNKKINPSSTISSSGFKIIDPLGNQYTNIDGPVLFLDSLVLQNQVIPLTDGWNIISFNVQPQSPDMQTILQDIIANGNLVKVINESGGFMQYIPGVGWMNTIGDMANTEGYYIKVNANTTLDATGSIVALPYDITLNTGWNIMGYPADQGQDAITVLQPLINSGHLTKVIDEAGGFIQYIPGVGWMNTIGNFEPGEGYYIKLNTNDTLTINENGSKAMTQNTTIMEGQYYRRQSKGNPYMPMHIVASFGNIDLEVGDEFGVFANEICIGSAEITDPTKPIVTFLSTDDPTTVNIDGGVEGETLTFKLLHRGREYTLTTEEQIQYDPLETRIIKFIATGLELDENSENTFSVSEVIPNPFSSEARVYVNIPDEGNLKVDLLDLRGSIISTIYNQEAKPGKLEIKIEANDLKQGMYFVHVRYSHKEVVDDSLRKVVVSGSF